MMRVPVAVFCYNRAEHLGRALESLAHCIHIEDVDVHIFCDAAKGTLDAPGVEATRRVAAAFAKRARAIVHCSPTNRGCDHSIVDGVTSLCTQYGRVIVIEDDFIVSPDFLHYMLEGLDRYASSLEVYQLSGFMYRVPIESATDALFMPIVTSRGWATWKRAWDFFDWNLPEVAELFSNRRVRYRFDFGARFGWSHTLYLGLKGGTPNWDTVWYWAVFRRSGLVLFPKRSLVWVGGWDGTGVHGATVAPPQEPSKRFSSQRLSSPIIFPDRIAVDRTAFIRVKRFAGRAEGHSKSFLGWVDHMAYDELMMNHPRLFERLQPLHRRIFSQ